MYFLFKKRTTASSWFVTFSSNKEFEQQFPLPCVTLHWWTLSSLSPCSETLSHLQSWTTDTRPQDEGFQNNIYDDSPWDFFPPYLDFYPPFSICTFQLYRNNEQTFLELHKSGTFHFPCRLRETHKLFGINSKNAVHFVKLYSKHPVIFHWKH